MNNLFLKFRCAYYLYPNLIKYDLKWPLGCHQTNFYKIHHCEMFYTTWYAKKYILTQKGLTNQTILRKSGDKSMTKVITRRRALQLARLKNSELIRNPEDSGIH